MNQIKMKNLHSESVFQDRLSGLIENNQQYLLTKGLKGIEKESLRITPGGMIAQSPHPQAYGSALTNPYITTDYSEALLEFITPPFPEIETTLRFLENIQQYVYDNLQNELLLATSMPCGISGDESIPVANYGTSNIGKMKHIYRIGLGYRYGRAMQAISGIHYNYSVREDFWPIYQQLEKNTDDLQYFISDSYFALIRNLKRYGWLLLYLFGSSPAICKSFLQDRKSPHPKFDEFDDFTFFKPFATSLRMSDIGYKSTNQANLNISYNSLHDYISSLTSAMETPFPDYQAIGLKVDGNDRQLSANLLQIENEYYSQIRPKQVAFSGEKPTRALQRRGVRYIEIRSLDIGAFSPIGIDSDSLRFIEALVLFCLLAESPKCDLSDIKAIEQNSLKVTYYGRDPEITLINKDRPIKLREWALEICEPLRDICKILDHGCDEQLYLKALTTQLEAIKNSDLTPSANILQEMQKHGESFSSFALRISKQHEDYFRAKRLGKAETQTFLQAADDSVKKQRQIESADQLPFDKFLDQYFSQ